MVLSDGTAAGTFLVKDINPVNPGNLESYPGYLSGLVAVGAKTFFDADDGVQGRELWKSDGTAAGTTLVKDINPSGDSNPAGLTNINGTLFFSASDGASAGGGIDRELWKSDGTTAGTVLVKDLRQGRYGLNPQDLTAVNGVLYFTADDGVHGRELWKSDGTAAGTALVKDITPGTSGYGPRSLVNGSGTLYFIADDGAHGGELWRSDGTGAGTALVKDIVAGNIGSEPGSLTNAGGTVFFSADDGKNGRELWKSDGTARGTVLVKDVYSGSTNFSYHGYYGHVHTRDPNSSNPANLLDVNGTLYFTANDGTHGTELWRSDGTSKGTVLVSDIRPGGASSGLADLTGLGSTLFFRADDGTRGWELWKSDGTATGTVLVRDINPGSTPYYSGSFPADLTAAGSTLFFRANDGSHGRELWESDGSAAGTALVKDINPGGGNSDPESLTVAGGHLFFSANDGVHGIELWDPPLPPVSGTDAIPTRGSMGSHGVGLAPDAPRAEGDAGVAVLPTSGAPSDRPGPETPRRLSGHPSGPASARAARTRWTRIVDRLPADPALHPRMPRPGLASQRPGNPDLPEVLASSWRPG